MAKSCTGIKRGRCSQRGPFAQTGQCIQSGNGRALGFQLGWSHAPARRKATGVPPGRGGLKLAHEQDYCVFPLHSSAV